MSTRSSSGRRRGRRPEDDVLARRPGWLADAQAETDEMMRSLTRVAARGTPRAPAASTATATPKARPSGWSKQRRRPPRSPRPLRIAEYGPLLESAAVGGDVFNEESTLPRKIRRLSPKLSSVRQADFASGPARLSVSLGCRMAGRTRTALSNIFWIGHKSGPANGTHGAMRLTMESKMIFRLSFFV